METYHKGAIAAAGNCSIPITLVILGAYFYSPPEPPARHLPEHQHRERTVKMERLEIWPGLSSLLVSPVALGEGLLEGDK
ncbi:hypothetical protein LXA43DRAFT_1102101 [Ganoderma leucocontextum]|nr:hypothetical protein LXA43DRAFT_1102101 [Ganoderma leucocontextum]